MDLSIVILNYKQTGMVKQCVKGILASQPQLAYEIIVVDNNSGDNCLTEIKKLFAPAEELPVTTSSLLVKLEAPKPPLLTIQAKENGGFAVGNNLGIKQAKGEYVMVINPDIAVVPGVLEKMVAFMQQNPRVGIIGPKLINPDGSVQYSCRRFPSLLVPLYRRTILGNLPFAKRRLNHYLMVDWQHEKNQAVDWLFGACLLIRKSVLDQVGLFDERFFMYFEDLDFCRRVWEADFLVYYFADVEMVHYHQRLSAEHSGILGVFSKAGRIHLESGIKYFAKYLGVKLPKQR
ncbi:MAG: hypothetical protein A3A24_00495 [Candidatus Buchananbacteria bacterium RIFCSPLOWO2_01_FULL_46_12]|uniref:Glycosyltransferase 2-like domain-containing protein n=2 Tax=Candidatus Buchananiibacteriota TaxID=1817903 RepID=A0A1G1YQU3_9BACT|nr:MAG: hypothetical protein A2744_03805 [Candidatus Buchananbacteria bacterium RIFCSPHIGHO2_01_FULL_44_11]OGY53797.1 MAG: hypothetical protein A3A24_00495 [Candidatus Buchananbacteria bacterium RIFCSPLOWO2_01_FULL_46_12]